MTFWVSVLLLNSPCEELLSTLIYIYRGNLLHVKMQHIVGHGRTQGLGGIFRVCQMFGPGICLWSSSPTGNCILCSVTGRLASDGASLTWYRPSPRLNRSSGIRMQISMNGTFWRTSDDRTPLGRFHLKITHARHNTRNDGGWEMWNYAQTLTEIIFFFLNKSLL